MTATLFPFATTLAGVMGDGNPLVAPTLLTFLNGCSTFKGSSGPSLLGAGVRLLLDPLIAVLVEVKAGPGLTGVFEPLSNGKASSSSLTAPAGFFWKNPMIDFWFLADDELEVDFLRAGGWSEGGVAVRPAMLDDTRVVYLVPGQHNAPRGCEASGLC